MLSDTLLIATAGSGKTTFLIKEALKIQDDQILILTYTNANESEIKSKILKENLDHKFHSNITVQTWFSFLIKHGVKPYQGIMHPELYESNINGLYFTEKKSGFRFYKKNRDITSPHYLISDIAHIPAVKSGLTSASHNDQIYILFFGKLDNFLGRITEQNTNLGMQS